MNNSLSSIAAARIAAASLPPQRYGLSVFLRKAYPTLGDRHPTSPSGLRGAGQGTGNREPKFNVRGARVERATWNDLPREIVELVRKRVADDSLAAAHVLRTTSVQVVRVVGDRAMTLENLVAPAAATTLLIDVAPHAKLVVQEGGESVPLQGNTFTEGLNESEGTYASALVLLWVGEGARVQWFGQSVYAPGFTVVERLAILGKDAVLEQHSVLLAANALRENVHVALDAPGATARVNTLFAGASDPTSPDGLPTSPMELRGTGRGVGHQFDLGITTEHRAPHTVSNLAAKGVLSGKAQAVVRGLVRIEREAPGSDGYQRCDTLLLSPAAEVDPIPNLEINTNDVRCTHGVTTGRLNAEQLFYLQSRGFSDAAARDLLVGGFLTTMLRLWPEEKREELKESINDVLKHA